MDYIKNKKLIWMVTISGVFSFAILNRWLVTDLKLKSFGRIWQYYVSWSDFGFHRRGLVGTLLTETGLNKLVENEYLFSYLFYGFLLVASYSLVVKYISSNEKLRNNNMLTFCVLLSPATFSHLAYSTGTQDLILFILLLVAVFFVRGIFALSIVLVSGVLVHELFIFLLPGIFVLKFLTREDTSHILDRTLVVPALATLMAIVVVTTVGKLNVSISIYDAIMAQKMPLAAHQHPLWSGYFEVASTIDSNTRLFSKVIDSIWSNRWFIVMPTIYSFLIASITACYLRSGLFNKFLVFASILFPLMTIFVATDYYRWVSISACVGLVGMLLLTANDKLIIPARVFSLLIFFTVLSPFGAAALGRPFPMHQLIMEKLVQ